MLVLLGSSVVSAAAPLRPGRRISVEFASFLPFVRASGGSDRSPSCAGPDPTAVGAVAERSSFDPLLPPSCPAFVEAVFVSAEPPASLYYWESEKGTHILEECFIMQESFY